MLIVAWERDGGMRRNANGARDFFAPVKVGEEVLAESLASHWVNSVAGVVTSERWHSGMSRPGRNLRPQMRGEWQDWGLNGY
jgi:hypothetical protein